MSTQKKKGRDAKEIEKQDQKPSKIIINASKITTSHNTKCMLIYISIWNMSALMKKRGIRSLIETLGAAQKKRAEPAL